MQQFLSVIENHDPEAAEGARDWVKPEHIKPLIDTYWQLTDWEKKRTVVEILQDQTHAEMQAMMLDFLQAPDDGQDITELAKAIALTFIDEKYNCFMTYYNDRQRLASDVAEVLHQRGLQTAFAPGQQLKNWP